jgi:hypothetical protein
VGPGNGRLLPAGCRPASAILASTGDLLKNKTF